MYRRNGGQPIRDAIKRAGLSIPRLAARTKEIDPDDRGLSQALVGFYVSDGASGRESVSTRTAELMAAGLDSPIEELFGDQPDPPSIQVS
ncbi:XRE family transcriptional regulator [Streptomyces niveus]